MDRKARTRGTVKIKDMTGRSQTLPWWLGEGGGGKDDKKIRWPRWMECSIQTRDLAVICV